MCSHVAQRVQDFLILLGVEVIRHTSYCSDLTPSDFFLFPTGKKDLKGPHFESRHVTLGAAETAFKPLVQNGF